ncbi:MAG: RNA polymerase sigma factor [Ignavibacteria bacterium]|nr:RNA polymerase sigma factor [Ignavibacteria bacterium]
MQPDAITYTNASDEQLLLSIRLQKPTANAAFSELYDRYHGRVAKYCIALLGKQDGNDAFQETFVKFYHAAGRTVVENVPAMLTTIARNVCIDLKRRRKHTVVLDDDTPQRQSIPPSSGNYEQQELMRLIEIGLEYLDFDIREAFVLRHYQDLSYQEIAMLTGVPETTVTKRIWRAKERLKQVLSPFINDLNQL